MFEINSIIGLNKFIPLRDLHGTPCTDRDRDRVGRSVKRRCRKIGKRHKNLLGLCVVAALPAFAEATVCDRIDTESNRKSHAPLENPSSTMALSRVRLFKVKHLYAFVCVPDFFILRRHSIRIALIIVYFPLKARSLGAQFMQPRREYQTNICCNILRFIYCPQVPNLIAIVCVFDNDLFADAMTNKRPNPLGKWFTRLLLPLLLLLLLLLANDGAILWSIPLPVSTTAKPLTLILISTNSHTPSGWAVTMEPFHSEQQHVQHGV